MSSPRKITRPPTTCPGGDSSWDTANRSVDFPHPDSPTTPRNSWGSTVKLTRSTARTSAASVRYSTDRSVTSSSGSGTPPPFPHRPQRRVSDLVEGVVQQREADAHQRNGRARRQLPEDVAGLERGGLLGVVE